MNASRSNLQALLLFVAVGSSVLGVEDDGADLSDDRGLRRPVAVERSGSFLVVGNRDSGSVSIVDPGRREVVVERRVGREVSDIALAQDLLLVTDQAADELVLLRVLAGEHPDVTVLDRLPVPRAPVSVEVLEDGRVTVASLWAQQLTIVRIDGGTKLVDPLTVDLPFAPRRQCAIEGRGQLVVAASFSGDLAVIDSRRGELVSRRSIEGHNIRGLVFDAARDELLLTHQQLNGQIPTIRSRVFWGAVMANLLRTVPTSHLLARPARSSPVDPVALTRWSLYPLGEPGRAAGDPGRFAVTRSGRTVLLSEGVDELFVLPRVKDAVSRVAVGNRPVDLVLSEDERLAYVVNMFDDSVSVVDLEAAKVRAEILLGERRRLTTRERGEVAFHDARLSLDGWASCHSCHTDGHTSGLLNDNFGDGSEGTPKKIPSLGNVGATGPWGWTGRKITLDEQITRSIETTMRLEKKLDEAAVTALIAFVGRLEAPPSILEARGHLDPARVEAGRRAFKKNGCERCHSAPLYETAGSFRVGLSDEAGVDRFNPPSLLGIRQRVGIGYFHDGRSKTLRDVFEKHHHPRGKKIDPEDVDKLVYFLRSL